MEWWHAVILGLVEGITEYLPISSTGHLILASAALGLDDPEVKDAVDAFNIVIQGGAILAVLGLYRERVIQMCKGLLGVVKLGPGDPVGLKLATNIIVAFLPAAVLGVLFNDWIEEKLFAPGPVLLALGLGGVYMIALDRWRMKRLRTEGDDQAADLASLTPLRALVIGLLQCIAMWPGTSRSMMTITGGVLVGLKPKDAAEFSFLLGLPTLGGACVYSLYKNLSESAEAGTPNLFDQLGWTAVLLGVAVATASAVVAVRWLVSFLNKHGLEGFGWYRLALCVVVGAAVWMGWIEIGDVPGTGSDAGAIE
ncbi:MAG: undecaprenyl-diphosphate phosphatase [Planctomycetota bacterium]